MITLMMAPATHTNTNKAVISALKSTKEDGIFVIKSFTDAP